MSPSIAKHILFFALLQISVNICAQSLFKNISMKNGLSGNIIYDIEKDTAGNLWFATANGVTKFDGRVYDMFSTKSGLPENLVIDVELDEKGLPWFRTISGYLCYYSNNKFYNPTVNVQLIEKLKDKLVNNFYFSQSGEIFISTVTGGGLYKISSDKKNLSVVEPLPGNCSYYFKINSGNYITGAENIFPSNNKLLLSWDGRNQIILLSSGTGYSKSIAIKKTRGSFLYANGFEVLAIGSRGVEARVLFESNIENIYFDHEKKLWIGFNGAGVRCFPSGDVTSGNFSKYLGDKTVTSFEEDNNGNLWIGTVSDGIYFLPGHLHISSDLSKNYFKKEILEDDDKEISITNVIENNDSSITDTFPPEIFISGIVIMERDTTILPQIKLKHDQNYIRINFAGFGKNKNAHLQYKYRMKNVDKDWVFTSASSVQYTTLPPGEYSFEVSAVNLDGYWSNTPATVNFEITPPYWQTWWFRTGAGVSVTAFFIFFLAFRERRIKKRERERMEVERKMSDLELKALRAQMNPHFIFNSLNSIQNFIINNDIDSAIRYQSKFAKLIRSILENSKKSVIPLEEELKSLEIYLQLEALRFDNKFNYSIDMDKKINIQDTEIPTMLIQPYVENAIWHGLMHKETQGSIKILITKKKNIITCSVEDNGVGRQKSLELESKNRTKNKSMGMTITKERLDILNVGRNGHSLNVKIEDLKNENGEATGTRVNINIPCEV